jgi:NTP pyrophosphatase (non-canonical NTP hydrolase)
MIDLDRIQEQHRIWTDYNFPDAPDHHSLIGAFEEMGELAHAWLKREQGIRGHEHDAEARDAIGDIIIYLLHFCTSNGWRMSEIIQETWDQVQKRDWVKFPTSGAK